MRSRKRTGVAAPSGIRALRSNLHRNDRLRRAVQSVRVASSLRPAFGFLWDLATDAPTGVYRSRRTGRRVVLRPRPDLHVARELISKDAYVPPAELTGVLSGHRPLRVLDLGANIGLFTLTTLARYGEGTTVVAVEPDRENLRLLRRNVAENDLDEIVEIVGAAAGTADGSARFRDGLRETSRVEFGAAADRTVEVPVIDFFRVAAGCDLIKMDIEGSEWPLLRDPRAAQLDAVALALEWHEYGSETDDPATEAEQLLRAAGFEVHHCDRGSSAGTLWAWRSS